MKKQILFAMLIIAAFMNTGFVFAQEKKVAIFDPAGNLSPGIKEIVREEISSIIVNLKSYTVLERQLIDKVLEENKFQMGGLVDDNQVGEMGKRMGADYVFVTSITPFGNNNFYLSFKMIEVQTARIEWQKTGRTSRGENEIIDLANRLVKEMFVEEIPKEPIRSQPKVEIEKTQSPNEIKLTDAGMLVTNGKKIYMNNKKLSKVEVKNLYTTTFNKEALAFYEKGRSRKKTGNILITSAFVSVAAGFFIGSLVEIEEPYYVYNDYSGTYNTYYDYHDCTVEGLVIGGAVGAVLGTTGIILKQSAKKNIKKSVNSYNLNFSGKAYHPELKLEVTPKGRLGLVYSF